MKRALTILAVIGMLGIGIGSAVPTDAAPAAAVPIEEQRTSPDGPDPDKAYERFEPEISADAVPAPRTEGIAGGYVYVPITPYRTFDSRDYVDGLLFGGDSTRFDVLTDSRGNRMIPSSAVAVTYNLTVVTLFGSGFLGLYPSNAGSWPGTSSINWTAGDQVIANGGTVAIGFGSAPGQVSVYCGPATFVTTDFLLDITGYYM